MTYERALQAIHARFDGVWDDPALQEIGPLHTNPSKDVERIFEKCSPDVQKKLETYFLFRALSS